MRALAAVVALAMALGCAADDTDPDSDTCKQARAQYIKVKLLRDQAASADIPTTAVDVQLAELVNKHWDCFK